MFIGGKTNYEEAFKKGIEMLNHAKHDNFGSQCQNSKNIFLFLTDGEPTIGLETF